MVVSEQTVNERKNTAMQTPYARPFDLVAVLVEIRQAVDQNVNTFVHFRAPVASKN
jgi:hypothetical protein